MPEMMRLAVWPLGLRALFTAPTSRTSPYVTLRWEEMIDCETPLEQRSSVSFDGVRATVKCASAGISAILGEFCSIVRAVQK